MNQLCFFIQKNKKFAKIFRKIKKFQIFYCYKLIKKYTKNQKNSREMFIISQNKTLTEIEKYV